ncbi:glycosyltransferase family 2 protein [Microcystis elabens FACHB-917]|nr:glycosyltransferase family 2 protein [Microcystis elabens FACHB-917]
MIDIDPTDTTETTKDGPSTSGQHRAELAIVTVAYHSQAPLERLAADLALQNHWPQRWLVVDNAPQSAPLRLSPRLKALPVERISGREGAGFGEGCNRGFEILAALGWQGWVWLLNPDISLVDPDVIGRLQGVLASLPPQALVGTAVLDAEGGLEASGGWVDPGLAFRRRRVGPTHRAEAAAKPLRLDWLSGCSLALRPTAHTPPARFDPALPLYYEDIDLCLRLGAGGATCLWSAAVTVGHRRGGGSGGDPARRLERTTTSYWRFLQRHRPAWQRLLRGLRLLSTSLARLPWRPRRSMAVLGGLARAVAAPIGPVPGVQHVAPADAPGPEPATAPPGQ